MSTRKPGKRKSSGSLPRPCSASVALALATWRAARDQGMYHEDVIGCCAVLLDIVEQATGEDRDYLLSEIKRRAPSGVKWREVNTPNAGDKAAAEKKPQTTEGE